MDMYSISISAFVFLAYLELITGESYPIGIDLGTTFSCVAYLKNGRAEVIPNEIGNRITPSYVAFTSEGERLIGDSAKNQLTRNPENTVFDSKRLIGRKWDEVAVQESIRNYPFKVDEHNGKPIIELGLKGQQKIFTPEEISAMVLQKMKQTAETYLGTKVTDAVVTVPAYFNDAQRRATKVAGRIAGLNILKIINEPTAAGFAYGFEKRQDNKNLLVFDLGGGTFDVTVLAISGASFKVLATNGNTHLGGEDFDQRVVDYFIDLFKKKTGKDARQSKRAVQVLRKNCEEAKRVLSYKEIAWIEVDSLMDGIDLHEKLTRPKFEELNDSLFKSCLIPLEQVLKDARHGIEDIDEVVLVGGSTRIPKIQQLVRKFFNGKKPSHGVNPDEAVALGAAVQAAILTGQDQGTFDLVLLDVNPLSLGIDTFYGQTSPVIPRNTLIPTQKSSIFYTAFDNQDEAGFFVYEGEKKMSVDNHFLGMFTLVDVPKKPEGKVRFNVTFEIDADGILTVTAMDLSRGVSNNIVISYDDSRLPADEIGRMIADAEAFAVEDNQRQDAATVCTQLEHKARVIQKKYGGSGLMDTLTDILAWLDKAGMPTKVDCQQKLTTLKQKCDEHGIVIDMKDEL